MGYCVKNKFSIVIILALAWVLGGCVSAVGTSENTQNLNGQTNPDGQSENGPTGSGDLDFSLGPNLPLVTCNELGPQPGDVNPILFVTRVPLPSDFGDGASTFGNHRPSPKHTGRGDDLRIRYPDGTFRNLTLEAGFGDPDGLQAANSIAVRDPSMHWCGKKAIFSMIIGSKSSQGELNVFWQLYEVTGLEQGGTAVITKVPKQPDNYNNIYPIYDSYGRIVFVSDMPHLGDRPDLYPVRDEYEGIPSNTGIWNLDSTSGELFIMDHSPSGNFKPSIDSAGRVIFTRWDHMIREDQALQDNIAKHQGNNPPSGTFNFDGEHLGAQPILPATNATDFPEPPSGWIYYVANNGGASFTGDLWGWEPDLIGNNVNSFIPWMMSQNGTELETLNHIGRQELLSYIEPVFKASGIYAALEYQVGFPTGITNQVSIGEGLHQVVEDSMNPGVYYGVVAPEFKTHASGQIVTLLGDPSLNGNQMSLSQITHPDTRSACSNIANCPNHTGFYRDPVFTTSGFVVASHTTEIDEDYDSGTPTSPVSQYDFRLKVLQQSGSYYEAGAPLTPGFYRTLSFWHLSGQYTFNNVEMWELFATEVVSRPVPVESPHGLEKPELEAAKEAGITGSSLVDYLQENNLALIIMRNITRRDANDLQQPFNLEVADSNVQALSTNYDPSDTVFRVSDLQLVENKLLRGRGLNGSGTAWGPGRRGIGQFMDHSLATNLNPPSSTGLPGTVKVHKEDGSVAAVIPAGKAMSWQLVDQNGKAVVREKVWVTFRAGEVRVCANCHGVNEADQTGATTAPQNTPKAAIELFEYLKYDLGVID